jgi:large subunit ribosomal protein L10
MKMAHVAAWKKDKVTELANAMKSNTVIAVVDLHGIPSAQLQQMRKRLRANASVMMSRNTLVDIAIDEAAKERPGLEAMKGKIEGQCAVVATDMNPFRLFREMEATKSKAAARAGDVAPEDIEVRAGETSFKPGPIVGELQKVGIPAGIESGKVVIKKDKLLVKKGEKITAELAAVLPRLEILPMTVGMDLKAAFEDGLVYDRKVLDIPADYYTSMLALAGRNALALGVKVAYPTPETMRPLMSKAYRDALALSVKLAIPTKDNIRILLGKAEAEMLALAARVPEIGDDRLKQKMASAPAPQPSEQQKPTEAKEEKKEEKVSEEDAAAGLGALFG